MDKAKPGLLILSNKSLSFRRTLNSVVRDILIFSVMHEDRNKSSHIYDKATAGEIFERVKKTYVVLIEKNIALFKKYIDIEMA